MSIDCQRRNSIDVAAAICYKSPSKGGNTPSLPASSMPRLLHMHHLGAACHLQIAAAAELHLRGRRQAAVCCFLPAPQLLMCSVVPPRYRCLTTSSKSGCVAAVASSSLPLLLLLLQSLLLPLLLAATLCHLPQHRCTPRRELALQRQHPPTCLIPEPRIGAPTVPCIRIECRKTHTTVAEHGPYSTASRRSRRYLLSVLINVLEERGPLCAQLPCSRPPDAPPLTESVALALHAALWEACEQEATQLRFVR